MSLALSVCRSSAQRGRVLRLIVCGGLDGIFRSILQGQVLIRPAIFEAEFVMAAAAIVLPDVAEGSFEGTKVLHARPGCLGITAKLGEPCFKVIHVLPDFWTGAVGIVCRRLVDRIRWE